MPKTKMTDLTRTPKLKKDPNAPKRAKSAYIIFSTEEGKKVRQDNPEMSAPDVLREVGRRWDLLDHGARVAYEQKAEEDKERYAEEMESYTPPVSPTFVQKRGKKSHKDPNAPKRALSAYLFFSQAEFKKIRAANPNMTVTEVMRSAAAGWAGLGADARKVWESKAVKDRERFDEEMAAYAEAKEE